MERKACELELVNLVNIKIDEGIENFTEAKLKKVVLREALIEWKEQQEVLDAKVEKRIKRNDGLTNEIYQLVGLYSVFVGVVFTAVLQSARVECQHIWSPIVLCSVAYFVILFITIKKFKEINKNQATIEEDDGFRKAAFKNLRLLKSKGHDRFDFSRDVPEENKIKIDDHHSSKPVVIITILTFFTSVLLFSFVHILCINTKGRCINCEGCPRAT